MPKVRAVLAARAAFPDATSARLEVEAQNPEEHAFYVKEGFVEIGEDPEAHRHRER